MIRERTHAVEVPVAAWVYKATPSKISLEETRALAVDFHFLCRALYFQAKDGSLIARPHTRRVGAGDVIHFYYKQPKQPVPEAIGTFRVVNAERYPDRFAGPVEEDTALVEVKPSDRALMDLLEREHRGDPRKGYQPDPKHHVYTGWALEPTDERTPEYPERLRHKPRVTLSRYASAPSSGASWARITFDPNVMGGKPCIRGLRVTVGTLVGLLAAGRSTQEILGAYPYLEEADIRDALAYAAWRAQEQDLPLSAA